MNIVRDLRNASAHSNCLINKLFEPLNSGCQIDSIISNYVKNIPGISAKTRAKNLNYRIVYNFITLIYIYDFVVPNGNTKLKRNTELKELFNIRMIRNKEYFTSNNRIISIYKFVKKVIDRLSS